MMQMVNLHYHQLHLVVHQLVAGTNDYNVLSNLGTTYLFWVETLATDMDILTDGTDKFYGAVFTGIDSEETGENIRG